MIYRVFKSHFLLSRIRLFIVSSPDAFPIAESNLSITITVLTSGTVYGLFSIGWFSSSPSLAESSTSFWMSDMRVWRS